MFNTKSEFDNLINKWGNNVSTLVNTKLALGRCPVDIVKRLAGNTSAGCCGTAYRNTDGMARKYLQIPYFPHVEWDPNPSKCLTFNRKRGPNSCRNVTENVCESIVLFQKGGKPAVLLAPARGKCYMYGSASKVSPGQGNQSGGVILSPLHPDCLKDEPCMIRLQDNYWLGAGRGQLTGNGTYSECMRNIRKHENYYGEHVRSGHWKAAQWVPHNKNDIKLDGSNWGDEVAKIFNMKVSALGKVLYEGGKWIRKACKAVTRTVCDVATYVIDTASCLVNQFSPTVTCQTGLARISAEFDMPIRYRRTARYGKRADGHMNVIPGRWTPDFEVHRQRNRQGGAFREPDHRQQQSAEGEGLANEGEQLEQPGPIWHSHGWGDQMGITAIGFVCPAGSTYGRVGKKDMPHSTSTEEAREWDSANHAGHQDDSVFLPEYRQAGMFNSRITTGLPNLYDYCASTKTNIFSTPEKKQKAIDEWGDNCGWYFEGYRRRANTMSKVDGDASTGGAWSEIDLGVWSRDVNNRDKCYDAMKNKKNHWGKDINKAATKADCIEAEGTWVEKDSKEEKLWGSKMDRNVYLKGNGFCVGPCLSPTAFQTIVKTCEPGKIYDKKRKKMQSLCPRG